MKRNGKREMTNVFFIIHSHILLFRLHIFTLAKTDSFRFLEIETIICVDKCQKDFRMPVYF